jgi:hypothetical protein
VIKLFGKSQIIAGDECISVFRQGTDITHNVNYVAGKPVKRNGFTFKVKGNVQPMSPRDLLLVPELERFKEQYWLYIKNVGFVTEEGLEIQTNSILLIDDQITRLQVNFTVQSIENWGSFIKARIMRLDTGPNATP